ncbi:hypothetical protein [Rhodococcus sp. WMMA185]|uniref:hypothetical protein n=1 Tax=Rhodococcus sp. WMMA185 TaxID=679318 RepID=UPI0012F503F2|nr:hypothetical protein [Rhodococcus sp. WMMA185]
MKTSVRAAVTAVVAAPLLATLFAAPANAAPEDVTVSAAVEGKNITVSVVNDSPYNLSCDWTAKRDTEPRYQYGTQDWVFPDSTEDFAVFNVATGDYKVHWSCVTVETEERWGTWAVSTQPTADPIPLTVGNALTGSLDALGSLDLWGSLDAFGSLGSAGLLLGS